MIQKEKIANFKMTTKRYKILIKKILRCKSKRIAPTKRYKIQDIDTKNFF